MTSIEVPTIDVSTSKVVPKTDFDDAYSKYQAIHIRGFNASDEKFSATDIQSLFQSLVEKDKESWCIENKSNDAKEVIPCDFLDVNSKIQKGYCSFLVQHSEIAVNELMNRLPLVDLPVAGDNSVGSAGIMKVKYGPCVWFFFGKNYKSTETTETLLGRPEHTDSVSHDGTWHYQLSGTKIWRIRPADELLDRINNDSNNGNKKRKLNDGEGDVGKGDDTIELECKEGDILLLNTRLWWHSTVIPVQGVPSISYARDVYFDSNDVHGEEDNANLSKQQSMTNIDGTYAAEDIEAETILFTEHTMPDCELHRSKTNPNCQVVELEDESGESYMAVVSLRYIKAGEFFCVMESDSEGDDDDSEGEWDEDDVCKPCPT